MLQLGTCIGLPCADGGDPQCEGTVEVCTTLAMPKKRMRQAFEDGSIELTEKEMLELGVFAEDYREELAEKGTATVGAEEAGIEAQVCAACDSGPVYDDDNFTGWQGP